MLCSKCTSLARQRFRNVEILRFENDMISRGILLLVNESRLNTRETFWNILQELFYRYQSEILTGWKSYKYKKLQGRGGYCQSYAVKRAFRGAFSIINNNDGAVNFGAQILKPKSGRIFAKIIVLLNFYLDRLQRGLPQQLNFLRQHKRKLWRKNLLSHATHTFRLTGFRVLTTCWNVLFKVQNTRSKKVYFWPMKLYSFYSSFYGTNICLW